MSAPIPTGGHRSKAARLVAETLAQPGPSRALALLCLSQAEGHCGRAARLFIAQVGPKRHCAQGAAYSRSSVAKAMTHIVPISEIERIVGTKAEPPAAVSCAL